MSNPADWLIVVIPKLRQFGDKSNKTYIFFID